MRLRDMFLRVSHTLILRPGAVPAVIKLNERIFLQD